MKRLILLTLVLLIAGLIYASGLQLIALPVTAKNTMQGQPELRSEVKALAEQGLEIFFYNESYILAGTEDSSYSGARYLGGLNSGNYYLITKLPDSDSDEINSCGKLLLDLGTIYLLQSSYNELEIRQMIREPFTLMDLSPMRLSKGQELSRELRSTRTAIQDLVSQVSADSVLYFIQSLQNFQTRYALAGNRLEVANWIKAQFERFGITQSELHSYQWQGTTQYNVVATIPGTVYPDTYILVGGHHDSISNDNPMVFAPGADDNASGSVAAIEMARVMMATGFQPKCSVRFVTFSAEEFGLWGSKAYAQMADATDMDIRLMINHDMIANTSPNPNDPRILLMPYDGFMEQTDYAAAITSQYTPLVPVYGSMNLSASDSYSFWQRGFPVIYYFEYNFSQVYHSNNDIVANLDPVYCAKVIQASTAVAASYANMPSPPENLQALDLGTGNSIQLSWNAVTDPSFTSYKVYWGTQEGVYPNSQLTSSTVFTITDLTEGQTCFVAVSSLDNADNESYKVSASATPRLVPLTPANFTDSPVLNGINLSWTANTELDMNSYKLYRSQDPEVMGDLIATLNPNVSSYSDINLMGSLAYYCYRICAVDVYQNQSPFTEVLQSRPVTLDQGVLLIDESMDFGGSNPFQPTDEMVDDFYDEITENLNVTSVLDLESDPNVLRLADLAVFSAVLWHGNDYTDMVYPYSVKDAIKKYLEFGGKVLFSLYHPSQAFEMNAGYPASFDENTFINEVLGISAVDYEAPARFKYAISQLSAAPPLEVDPVKTPAAFNGHIFHVEGLNPNNSNNNIYTYGSDYASNTGQGSMNGEKIAVYNQYGLGKVITLSFPLYHMLQPGARQFVEYVFGMVFGLPVENEDSVIPSVSQLSICAAYPNPFSAYTSFEVISKDYQTPLEISVYNLKGQLVKRLFNAQAEIKTELHWDGTDENGSFVGSGVYLIKANQAGKSQTRKLLKIK